MNGEFNPNMDTIRASLSKIKALFLIFKIGQVRSPPRPLTDECAKFFDKKIVRLAIFYYQH